MAALPDYVVPWPVRLKAVQRILAGRRALCSADMALILAHAPVAPRIEAIDCLPAHGPALITYNHYCRPGHMGVWWATSLLFTAIAYHRGADPAWIITSEWYYRDRLRSATITPVSRWAFSRAVRVWGLLPMPPDERELARRAAAVRQALAVARQLFAAGGALGIAPEGQGETVLIEPPRGAGRFIARLARDVPVVPVGVCEEDGRLTARFGPPYSLDEFPGEDKRAADDRIKTEVMTAIADLLPREMRGRYDV